MPNDRSATPDVLPPGEHGSPTARRLLEAGVVAFAERGYHGVSVRDLAAAVGIQGASFYAHFESKERLLAELMLVGHVSHQAHVRDAILGAGAEPTAQLRAAIRANVAFHATYPLLAIVANSELHALSPENGARITALRHDAGVLVAAVIERGRTDGSFDCHDTWMAMSAIAGMGVRVAWWFRPPEMLDERALNTYPSEAAKWLPPGDYTVDAIADAYATFALRIVGAA